ncbi:ABC transporter substrate-binding protein [Polyangium jinanense]|uniref:Thiamine pyrimidine synthase n=1 Tax=Polyangium jinanense TaxID=2829994 RepID=A0A9X3X6F2_9BACT|nr:ABC transporter substrate-binding protein [Polyangium jinanense]MDC3955844.1 ABC transporter substrate-binding protein [Polyangium jinanense]MDC3983203.1 ABC transporter substrate-binding protein [Polyangium jinanense]
MKTASLSRFPRRAWLFLSLGLLATAAGCKGSAEGGGAAAGNKVKLTLNWVAEPEFGGFYAAREGGAYKRAGLDVDIMPGGAGVPVMQMVANGQSDFGVVGADDVIIARARGADVIPVFATYQTFPQGIMVHASRGAKTMADVFQSGTLAIEPGTAYAAYLKKKYGFDKVKIVPYDGGVARFVVDKEYAQQCFITSEPIAARKKGAEPKVFLVADEGFDPYGAVIITRKALWKENPDRVRAFVRASREGWRSYLDDPAPANAVMQKLNPTMDAETFTAAAAAQKPLVENPQTKKLGMMTRERWDTLGKQLKDLGIIDNVPPLDEYLVAIDE